MTINAYSEEYLDVCASQDYEGEIMADLTAYFADVRKASYEPKLPQLVTKINRRLSKIESQYPNETSKIIAPTENGWEGYRILNPTDRSDEYRIVVTSKNSNRVEESVNIGPRTIQYEPVGTTIRFT